MNTCRWASSGSRRVTAFTLVETLMVVAIMGMMASLLVMTIAGSRDSASIRTLAHEIVEADAFARSLARRGVEVVLTETPPVGAARSTGVWLVSGADQSIVREVGMPLGDADLALSGGDVAYDARGRSRDFVIEIGITGQLYEVRVAGVTGWSEVAETSL